ncbi:MAG TPA: DUF885 family protein [Thermoanaerobaculia bacterium]|nr:DUF885 family protein [Thermoanaerobaculia bacterium]
MRLVVDTGIHDKGWTRDQVIAYMRENDVNDVLAQTETDRYIAWPGQALAYKMGQLKIRELRERAKTQLGAHFDIKAFHDEILDGGALPLDLLETRVDGWIKARLPQKRLPCGKGFLLVNLDEKTPWARYSELSIWVLRYRRPGTGHDPGNRHLRSLKRPTG